MNLGFIKSKYPNEKRISLLPNHIKGFKNQLMVETGFGLALGISNQEYMEAGCEMGSREEVFNQCDAIIALKTLQPDDYKHIREGQMIIGWIHPEVSGRNFWQEQGVQKNLIGVDLDNIHPRVYYKNDYVDIPWIPRDFVHKNSFNAGIASTMNALMHHGIILNDNYKIAVLGSGNVSQGAMHIVSKFTSNVKMFYRKTMDLFLDHIDEYDIVISGIQIENGSDNIVTLDHQKRMKQGALIIDGAADGDGCIEGIDYSHHDNPIIEKDGKFYYCIANSPTFYYRTASANISESFSEWVYKEDVQRFIELAEDLF